MLYNKGYFGIGGLTLENIVVFSVSERDKAKRQDEIQTYIYDKIEKYVIVLRCQRKGGYYLLTAYHLNRPYAEKQLMKKMKSQLSDIKLYAGLGPISG